MVSERGRKVTLLKGKCKTIEIIACEFGRQTNNNRQKPFYILRRIMIKLLRNQNIQSDGATGIH